MLLQQGGQQPDKGAVLQHPRDPLKVMLFC
jgi:hypothetical protein